MKESERAKISNKVLKPTAKVEFCVVIFTPPTFDCTLHDTERC